jgi:hypothetical protein
MLNARPLLKGTIQAAGAITIYRFVGFDGNQASAQGQKCRGVSEFAAAQGDNISVVEKGSAIVESGGAVNVGDDIITDNEGRAITASALAVAAGAVAVTSAAANGASDLTGTSLPAQRKGSALSAASGAGQWIEVLLA